MPGIFVPRLLGIGRIGPVGSAAEQWVGGAVEWLRLAIDFTGAAIVALGTVLALLGFIRALAARRAAGFTSVRLTLGRYLALALEFQLGADILSTAVAPTWDDIGKLAAIAVIRTALNFFLTRELREAGQDISDSRQPDATGEAAQNLSAAGEA
jgi:uncharacterized membrane protein